MGIDGAKDVVEEDVLRRRVDGASESDASLLSTCESKARVSSAQPLPTASKLTTQHRSLLSDLRIVPEFELRQIRLQSAHVEDLLVSLLVHLRTE